MKYEALNITFRFTQNQNPDVRHITFAIIRTFDMTSQNSCTLIMMVNDDVLLEYTLL